MPCGSPRFVGLPKNNSCIRQTMLLSALLPYKKCCYESLWEKILCMLLLLPCFLPAPLSAEQCSVLHVCCCFPAKALVIFLNATPTTPLRLKRMVNLNFPFGKNCLLHRLRSEPAMFKQQRWQKQKNITLQGFNMQPQKRLFPNWSTSKSCRRGSIVNRLLPVEEKREYSYNYFGTYRTGFREP